MPTLSLVVPVYNRPDEVRELLQSLCLQDDSDFEVVIVEDGSAIPCEAIVQEYAQQLRIAYFAKPNSGPGQSRNYGAERAAGEWIVFLDSDCIIPAHYVSTVKRFVNEHEIDAFGGPDRAHESFTLIQKAINYSMTSMLTTGGIRGGAERMEKFHPRSFNMGITREVLRKTSGFSTMRFGEDIDMSIRIMEGGFRTALIKDAYVYHKRRATFRQFFKQVHNSGIARINLYKRHPQTLKLVHFLPSAFVVFVLLSLTAALFIDYRLGTGLALWMLLVALDASVRTKSLAIGLLSVVSSFIQLFSYGLGFLRGVWRRLVLKGDEFSAFNRNFYK
ncbi:MAG: glycosyltransferase [Flavobacteriales bacterium]|jgi:glycosyltransferase involved in cell wall biosynthesis